MFRRNELDDVKKIIGNLEEERCLTSGAEEFGINKSVLSSTWKTFQTIKAFTKGVYSSPVFIYSPDHRQPLLAWCEEHKNWTSHQWSRILFTDQSRFSTPIDLERGFHPSDITERNSYGGPGVVVWGDMLNGWTKLHFFDRDFVTGYRFCKDWILPHVSLFCRAIKPYFLFL
ncbi:transposable element Tcb2 transposase [Trichonephila clavipes]|nr:transposable element Tcb2 transposase [Trichonephila clavipes]